MVQKETQLVELQGSVDIVSYLDPIHAWPVATNFCNDLREQERLVEEDNGADADYKSFLLSILAKGKKAESNRKRREKDEGHDNNFYCEEENDPQYELFLECLKEYKNSYRLEEERNGVCVLTEYERDSSSDKDCDPEPRRKLRTATKQTIRHVAIEYEGNSSSIKECDPEPRRILRSAMKQKDGPSNQMAGVENHRKHDLPSTPTQESEKSTWRRSRNKSKSEKEENAKLSTTKMDPDYLTFMQTLNVVDDHYVCKYKGHTVVYDREDGYNDPKKEEPNDGYYSDVEILDSTFYKEGDPNSSTMNKGGILGCEDAKMQSEFRQKVISVLRKPYDEAEFRKLRRHIKLRKLEERHMELRHGRERSCSTQKVGRSYLDYHPELKRLLSRVGDDKPKCLNLLRGFFLWLEHSGVFHPWEDAECLAIKPDKC